MTTHKRTDRIRRALLVIEGRELPLRTELVAAGYETSVSTIDEARETISRFSPDMVLIELGERAGSAEPTAIALARRLRNEPSTYSLPLVFMWSSDDRSVRNALSSVGADDYFSKNAPAREVLARLDALFWRIEAGRRTAPGAGDQRLEIDNFMVLLDSIRQEIKQGSNGTIGLLYAVARSGAGPWDKSTRDRTLASAHGYLKLNLRRADSVTYYGPTTLLIYMPRIDAARAVKLIEDLRTEFLSERTENDFAVGLASFPNHGVDLESVIERAESTVSSFRRGESTRHVAAYRLESAAEVPANPAELEPEQPKSDPHAFENEVDTHLTPAQVEGDDLASVSDRSNEVEVNLDGANLYSPEPVPSFLTAGDEGHRTPDPGGEADRAISGSESEPAIGRTPLETSLTDEDSAPREVPDILTPENRAPADRHETARPRKTFVSEGIDARTVGDLSMSDIVQRVTAGRTRKTKAADGVLDSSTQVARSYANELHDSGAEGHKRLLLAVSDTKLMAGLNVLVRDAGYQVRAAFNGRQAMDLMRIERPDVVVLDYNLQGFDGLEVMRRIARTTGRLGLPVLLLLDSDNPSVRAEANAMGVAGVLNPPYAPDELLSSIRLAKFTT